MFCARATTDQSLNLDEKDLAWRELESSEIDRERQRAGHGREKFFKWAES